jgi:hypothetical protein
MNGRIEMRKRPVPTWRYFHETKHGLFNVVSLLSSPHYHAYLFLNSTLGKSSAYTTKAFLDRIKRSGLFESKRATKAHRTLQYLFYKKVVVAADENIDKKLRSPWWKKCSIKNISIPPDTMLRLNADAKIFQAEQEDIIVTERILSLAHDGKDFMPAVEMSIIGHLEKEMEQTKRRYELIRKCLFVSRIISKKC